MPDTPNFGWTYPTDGGSTDVWGDILNDMFVQMDSDLWTVKGTADAALPKAGGTMTGQIHVLTSKATRVDKGSVSGAQTLDLSAAQAFTITASGAIVFTFSNPATGTVAQAFLLRITAGNAGVTWPASVDWDSGTAPTLTAGVDLLGFVSFDEGTTWLGVLIASNLS